MFEDSIEMNITKFEDYRKFGAGIAVEDYFSRLTKRREKLYLKKLKDTAAYKRPIRDFIL